jgi:predicted RNase H-related nuclease YkuK (DUF458 family)
MEKKKFKHNKVPVDLLQHCFEQKAVHGDLKVFLGTDSIFIEGKIHYFTVVAFRYGKSGVHFIYTKETINSIRKESGKPDIFTRLWKECELSMALARFFVEKGVFDIKDIIIEIDYNNVVETISKQLIPATKGWATGAGFKCLAKIPHNHNKPVRTLLEDMVCIGNPELDINGRPLHPEDWTDVQIACKAANHLCKGV